MRHSIFVLVAVSLGATVAAGCGGGNTTVSGTVTRQGKPVVWGNVTVVDRDNVPHAGEIQEDGTFTVAGVPIGPCKVGVTSPNPESDRLAGRVGRKSEIGSKGGDAPPDRPRPAAGRWFPIPDQYRDPLTSGLTGEVAKGKPLDVVIP
jgi:hypothetical protein